MIWWFLGFLAGSAITIYIGSRLPARKIKRAQFGYDDPATKDYGKQIAALRDLEYRSN